MRPPILLLLALLAAALSVPLAPPLASQEPPRPRLALNADPNDWEAYFDWAVERVRERSSRAYEGFYWASRLEPSRAEPLMGMWVGFWMKERDRWQRYVRRERAIMDAPDVQEILHVRYQALLRNPLVHQGLVIVLYDLLPGRWGDDMVTRGMIAYAETNLQRSVDLLGRAIERQPDRNNQLRYNRALAFTSMNRLDSALVELQKMLEVLRARDERQVVDVYDSKEMIEYAIGRVQLELNQFNDARESFERALIEDAGFHTAHLMLGSLALRRRQTSAAITEMSRAAAIAPNDAWVRFQYGQALAAGRRDEEAAREFATVVELEPHWALARYVYAATLERQNRVTEAADSYEHYLRIAPRRATSEQQRARQVVAAVRGGG